jgi:hypothetical protein
VLDALAASGLSATAFAKQHSVQLQRVVAWRRRFASRRGVTTSLAPPAFVEVAPRSDPGPRSPSRYEIVVTTGEILRIKGAIDPAAVRALLDVIRAVRAC